MTAKKPTTPPQLPAPGRIVQFVSTTGSGVPYPAVVLRTKASTHGSLIENWAPRPDGSVPDKPDDLVVELPDDTTIDLLVHGLTSDYRVFAVALDEGSRVPELNEHGNPNDNGGDTLYVPRSWHWPII